MLLRKCCISVLFLIYSASVSAQQDKLITHFIYDKMSINPGKTGMGMLNSICATTLYRNQWDKVNGAPNSAILNIEADLSRFFPGGIGLSFYHDAIGFARQNNVILNYSYPITIGNGTLGLGIGVGIINYGMDPLWVPPTSNPDNSLPTGFAATNLDVNFGAYYEGKGFYAGISSTHLTESLLKQTVNNFDQTLLNKLFKKKTNKLGFYLVGDVGVGKTMILNFFFNELNNKKLRFHFNEFMVKFHNFIFLNKDKENGVDNFVKNLAKNSKIIYF